jgi:hypothetical protein
VPDELEKVMAEGTTRKTNDLLRRLVEKVGVDDRRAVKVSYRLPNRPALRTPRNTTPEEGLEPPTR